MRAMSFVAGVCILLTASAAMAQPPMAIGRVKTVTGEASVVRAGTTIPADVGTDLYESDRVRTAATGRLGLTLRDDTRVSIGPLSEVSLDSFRYAPAEGRLGLAIKFLQGVAVYVSGSIAKLAPDAVRLETPAAIVGVRGTTIGIVVGAP